RLSICPRRDQRWLRSPSPEASRLPAVIETQDLSKTYARGIYALRELTMSVGEGEFVFLTGPSGGGKSPLLRLLLLQERPTHGHAIVAGRNLARLRRNEV